MKLNNYETNSLIGRFPSSPMKYCKGIVSNKYDFETESKEEINFLMANPEIASFFFFVYKTRLEEIKKINNFNPHDLYSVDVLSLITTHYNIDPIISKQQIVNRIDNTLPYTNEFEEIICLIISNFLTSLEYSDNCNNDERIQKTKNTAFAFIYLLDVLQAKELNYNRTISVNRIDYNTNIVDLILSDWNASPCVEILKELKNEERNKLIELLNTKKELIEIFEDAINKENEIAIKTEVEWKKYIDIINSLSLEEKNTILCIGNDYSKKEKLNFINNYLEKYKNIENGYFCLNGEKINMLELSKAVKTRIIDSPEYCKVIFDDNDIKYVHPLLFNYVLGFSKTFNYCLICYHRFRIEQNREAALDFFKAALSIIENNMGVNLSNVDTIEKYIISFDNVVNTQISNKLNEIDELKLEDIQQDISTPNSIGFDLLKNDFENEELKKAINQNISKINDEYFVDNAFISKNEEQINNEVALFNEKLHQDDRKFIANQIICSVNIIYLFWNSLNIILNSKHTIVKNLKEIDIKRIRNSLYSVDCNLISKVYGNNVDKMYDYREEKTIGIDSIFEKESNCEIDSSNELSTILIDTIDDISKTIENRNINQLLEKADLLRDHIRIYPNSIDDNTIEKIDTCIKRICDCLIKLCKEKDDFESYYNDVAKRIGNKYSMLKDNTSCIDTLATAEMLFSRYSSNDYEKMDYSCISSLYYQAFEDSYIKLIWNNYSNYLNNLQINGFGYSYWINYYSKQPFGFDDVKGYLPDDRNRSRFTYYDRKEKKVFINYDVCMYDNFSYLINQIKVDSKLDKFCDYFSSIVGKTNRFEMFNDNEFMTKLKSFSSILEANVSNRNNASHGGIKITKEQCIKDRDVIYASESNMSLICWLTDNIKEY